MKGQTVKQFITPDWKRVVILAVFLFIAFAGYTQSWVFAGKDMGLPKPPLFDILAPFPFWVLWVISLFPLGMLSNLIVAALGYEADFIMRGPFWLFWAIQLIYFYVLSCTLAFAIGRFGRK